MVHKVLYSSSHCTDHMTPLISSSLHENTTLFSFAYHCTPPTSFSHLMSVSLDPSPVHGQTVVTRLWKTQVKRCHARTLSRNTRMCRAHLSKNQPFGRLGGKVAAGQLTRQSSKMMTMLVLGKFGLKPIQTRFKPNPNHLRWFGLGKSQSV
jgi:hypothetical protein